MDQNVLMGTMSKGREHRYEITRDPSPNLALRKTPQKNKKNTATTKKDPNINTQSSLTDLLIWKGHSSRRKNDFRKACWGPLEVGVVFSRVGNAAEVSAKDISHQTASSQGQGQGRGFCFSSRKLLNLTISQMVN